MKWIYVAVCRYDGCDECSGGSHILAASEDKGTLEKLVKEHEANKENHLHSFYVDIEEVPVR